MSITTPHTQTHTHARCHIQEVSILFLITVSFKILQNVHFFRRTYLKKWLHSTIMVNKPQKEVCNTLLNRSDSERDI
jgi:hypothetical protein